MSTVRLNFVAEEKVSDLPWGELSGHNFYLPEDWWDETMVLYSKEYTTEQMADVVDVLKRRCLYEGADWDDFAIETEKVPVYRFSVGDNDVVELWWVIPSEI